MEKGPGPLDARGPEKPLSEKNGRGEWNRTTDLYVPNVALYQAELHPDTRPK